ncbi:hypothetical protein FHS83_001858 [Rhizomicrobium palustre]|uniref:Oxidoreductase n=1 Tax=Rhizomicrobium palustre TaxID=189966 RepID=A0A846N011_9PROT|nr:SDR family NAD(P)-dependent oxidoreductase [Rhizomicrobium palustre]NIK88540.1 hypothetical protein [Rhizomicrobium palustre]
MAEESVKFVVVTGASTGIGKATAAALLRKGFSVFGAVRKREDGARLVEELGPRFTPRYFDVTDVEAVGSAALQVREALQGAPLLGLVNNAGIAVGGPVLHLPIADFRRQLEVNLTGQVIVTQAFAPLLMGKKPGRIVMMSSIGGENAVPFLAPYHTSKFGLEGLSESLRRELMIFGIDVIVIAPGAIDTPIWDKAEAEDSSPYAATPFAPGLQKLRLLMRQLKEKGLKPERVGELVAKALTAKHPKIRYEIVPDPIVHALQKHIPKRLADKFYAAALGLKRED